MAELIVRIRHRTQVAWIIFHHQRKGSGICDVAVVGGIVFCVVPGVRYGYLPVFIITISSVQHNRIRIVFSFTVHFQYAAYLFCFTAIGPVGGTICRIDA